ncbi:disease resistance protein At4g27190-like [Neltuma alba]|uniref:disease resistance protein At4g27190-like n=1 Tax=Neltuma alba TaxID=207710 RepID=UPI0010A543BA|nr:disease resistance protein At4g27190-like [Prosopis alba]
MEEIGTCLATKLAECLWNPISRRARYLFCFNQYIEDVEKIKKGLELTLADVNKHKEEAHRRTEEIMPSVEKWLGEVNAILKEVPELPREVGGGGKKCFKMSLKYSLAKEMDDKAKRMKYLKDRPPSEPFSLPKPPPNLSDQFSSKDVMDFKSRASIFNSLFEAIKDGKNKMVGLYGIGGSGKTTLAIEVGKKVERLKLFDKVVQVVVSRPLNVRNIQEQIKGKTGLKFEENIEAIIAARLLTELKRMKILIILDDVWSDLNLLEIGIPINENCRILLTTRRLDVCRYMGCEENFELPLLIEEEAWDLLKMHANGTHDSLNEFVGVGRKIVDECKGLPIAIVTMGRALRGRGILDWKRALWRLQQALPLDIDKSSKGPYACLKLSYDYLPTSLAKQLFLLCSMFPEDHQIHREDLIRFAKGTLKFEGNIVYAVEDARREILVSINSLLDSCLLMHTSEQACVKMHDLIRNVALWIAREQHQAILVDSDAVSKMLAENGSLKETKAISLWNLEGNFWQSNQLHCPTLEVLLLHPKGFIEDLGGIEALKILVLATSSFQWEGLGWLTQIQWSMPQSIVSSLINLHTLCFRGIALGDISFLGQLKGLEILDLRASQFGELPIGIVDMKKLKLLDVSGCEIEKSPLEVIGRCEQLEELYFWDKKSAIPENYSLSRLKRYVIYDTTSLSIPSYEDAPFLEYFDAHCIEELRALCIRGFKVSVSNSSMKDLILRANCLWLDNCRWDLDDINFEIKHLAISCCVEKRFIADNLSTNILQTGQVFSHLISLRLREMNSLEQVFQDSSITCSLPMLQELFLESCPELGRCIFTHATSLPKLRKLKIEYCDKLKWLFSYSLASQCPLLEELRIRYCRKLERLTDEEDAHGDCLLQQRESLQGYPYGNQTVVTTVESSFLWKWKKKENKGARAVNSELYSIFLLVLKELEYIWKGPRQSVSLHRLKNVILVACRKLRNIFTVAIVTSLPELKRLEVDSCEELEGIFCEESLENLSSSSNVCFPKLEYIRIGRCNKMKRVFSYSMASHHCLSLEGIYLRDCSDLEGVVKRSKGEVEVGDHGNLFPKLKDLCLEDLPQLREIYDGYEFSLLSGTTRIRHCPNMHNIPLLEYEAS